jgi:type IV secretory pathway VirB3-like protein
LGNKIPKEDFFFHSKPCFPSCTAVALVFAQISQFAHFAHALITGVVVLVVESVEAVMISLMVHKYSKTTKSNNGQTTNKQTEKHQTTNKTRAHTISEGELILT